MSREIHRVNIIGGARDGNLSTETTFALIASNRILGSQPYCGKGVARRYDTHDDLSDLLGINIRNEDAQHRVARGYVGIVMSM